MRYFHHTKIFFKLIRWNNLIIILISQVIMKAFVIDPFFSWKSLFDLHFLVLNTSTILIAAAGYIINDYYDIKIDLLNKPKKLVIGKFISRRVAIIWHFALSMTGVLLGFYNGYLMGALHVVSAFLLWLYSNNLKRLPLIGNICIALLSALSVFLVAVLYRQGYEVILCYSVFAFYISLIREIIKDMEDIRGDTAFGCRTLPIIWGFRKTKRLIYYIILVFTINIFVIFHQIPVWAITYFLLAVIAPLLYLWKKLIRADTLRDFKILSHYCKLIMATGLCSILFL